MPFYTFRRGKKIKEIFFHMEEKKEYIDPKGHKWERVFHKPQASFDTKINAFSQSEFNEKTSRKVGATIGEMTELSSQLSEQRAKVDGIDKIKEKTIRDYERRTLKKHPSKIIKSAEIDLCKGTFKAEHQA